MKKQSTPTRRELEFLAIIWDLGEATVRDVYERLRDRERIAQNTVQSILRVMEEKGLITHRVEGRAFVYRDAYSREQSVKSFVDRVFSGAAHELVASLLKSERLSEEDLSAIEGIVKKKRREERIKKGKK